MRLSKIVYWAIIEFILLFFLLMYLINIGVLKAWVAFGLFLLDVILFIGYMMLSNHMMEKKEMRYRQYPLRYDQCYPPKDKHEGGNKKKSFCFDYVTKTFTDKFGNRMGETGSISIEAYDAEHAKLLFEKEFPGIPYDEPY